MQRLVRVRSRHPFGGLVDVPPEQEVHAPSVAVRRQHFARDVLVVQQNVVGEVVELLHIYAVPPSQNTGRGIWEGGRPTSDVGIV